MDTSTQYGQDNFNLPHDVVTLPSKGVFYPSKKKSLKVGYLTAADENVLMSQNISKLDSLILTILRNKIYEPDINPNDLVEGDAEAVLLFLRNTAFGTDYNIKMRDPKTNEFFTTTLDLSELSFKEIQQEPNDDGTYTIELPKSGSVVKVKPLTMGDQVTLKQFKDSYPNGMIAPVITKKLEMQIKEFDGASDIETISNKINNLPISDSKYVRRRLSELEPGLDLTRTVKAPSGEDVQANVTFGAEFFRPFF